VSEESAQRANLKIPLAALEQRHGGIEVLISHSNVLLQGKLLVFCELGNVKLWRCHELGSDCR